MPHTGQPAHWTNSSKLLLLSVQSSIADCHSHNTYFDRSCFLSSSETLSSTSCWVMSTFRVPPDSLACHMMTHITGKLVLYLC